MSFLTGAIVFLVAIVAFAINLADEPRFIDESAFLSQSYFFDLLISGRTQDVAWVEYPAYDLPPLPKYLIGAALHAASLKIPPRRAAIEWYRKPGTVVGDARMLQAARRPSILLGSAGCAAIFALGLQYGGARVGLLSAALLLANPLYRLHARRAMADAPAECLILMSLAVGLALWKKVLSGGGSGRSWAVGSIAAGLLGGLAVLAKLNGGLGLMTLAAWCVLGLLGTGACRKAKVVLVGSLALAGAASLGVFVALNPFLYARPTAASAARAFLPAPPDQSIAVRIGEVVRHRVGVSRNGQRDFAHNALRSPQEKILALAVQGFGRFGPFGPSHSDSTRRFDWRQDGGALVWLPWVCAGWGYSLARGLAQSRRGETPMGWALCAQAVVATITVGAFLPLAWDRYFLSIQAGSILLASGLAIAAFDALVSRRRRS